jgi:hypothetical protein
LPLLFNPKKHYSSFIVSQRLASYSSSTSDTLGSPQGPPLAPPSAAVNHADGAQLPLTPQPEPHSALAASFSTPTLPPGVVRSV